MSHSVESGVNLVASALLVFVTVLYLLETRKIARANAAATESAKQGAGAAKEAVEEMRTQRYTQAQPFFVISGSPALQGVSSGRPRFSVTVQNVGPGPAVHMGFGLTALGTTWDVTHLSADPPWLGPGGACSIEFASSGDHVASNGPAEFEIVSRAVDVFGRRLAFKQAIEVRLSHGDTERVNPPSVSVELDSRPRDRDLEFAQQSIPDPEEGDSVWS